MYRVNPSRPTGLECYPSPLNKIDLKKLATTHWRGAREAEGAPLLREYMPNPRIEGSNPSLSAS